MFVCLFVDADLPTTSSMCENGKLATPANEYRGSVSVTVTGVGCLPWAFSSFTSKSYPDAGLEGFACRAPDNDVEPWCFLDDGSMGNWAYCNVC